MFCCARRPLACQPGHRVCCRPRAQRKVTCERRPHGYRASASCEGGLREGPRLQRPAKRSIKQANQGGQSRRPIKEANWLPVMRPRMLPLKRRAWRPQSGSGPAPVGLVDDSRCAQISCGKPVRCPSRAGTTGSTHRRCRARCETSCRATRVWRVARSGRRH